MTRTRLTPSVLPRSPKRMKRSRLAKVSKRKAKQLRVRAKQKWEAAKHNPALCQYQIPGACMGIATDWHEPLPRSGGGSITDATNRAVICRGCHRYATEHPKEAYAKGWLVSRYPGRRKGAE